MIKEIGKGDKIKFDDCLPMIKKCSEQKDSVDELVECFKMFDKDGKGYIALAELRHIYGNVSSSSSTSSSSAMR